MDENGADAEMKDGGRDRRKWLIVGIACGLVVIIVAVLAGKPGVKMRFSLNLKSQITKEPSGIWSCRFISFLADNW